MALLVLSPTLERGLTESDSKLACDAAGWLEYEDSTIDVVLTVSIQEDIPKFVIKKQCLSHLAPYHEMRH